jgi:hypothetical protein
MTQDGVNALQPFGAPTDHRLAQSHLCAQVKDVAKQLPQRSNAHVELSLSSDRDGLVTA